MKADCLDRVDLLGCEAAMSFCGAHIGSTLFNHQLNVRRLRAWLSMDALFTLTCFCSGPQPYDISKPCTIKELGDSLCYPETKKVRLPGCPRIFPTYFLDHLTRGPPSCPSRRLLATLTSPKSARPSVSPPTSEPSSPAPPPSDRPSVSPPMGLERCVSPKAHLIPPSLTRPLRLPTSLRCDQTWYYVAALLEHGIEVLTYIGKYDWICNSSGNYIWTDKLEWTGREEFSGKKLRNWHVDGKVAGQTRSAKGLTCTSISPWVRATLLEDHLTRPTALVLQ